MKRAIIPSWLVAGCLAASGCREVCTTDELRHGDRCVMRPVPDAGDDASAEPPDDEDAGGAGDGGDPVDAPDAAEPSGDADECPDSGCEAACTGEACVTDPCYPNPCANGGTCSTTGKLCACLMGFSGPTCEIDACDPSPCQHGGGCSRTANGTTCDCSDTGFGGNSCQVDINECAGIHVCSGVTASVSFAYACRNEQPFYSCVGLFPEWRLADPPNRYSAGGGVVLDAKTGLTWQQQGQGDRPWYEARNYCDSLSLGGFSDWRLPTRAELESIVDFGKPMQVLDPAFSLSGEFWSSSPFVGAQNMRWTVEFTFGDSVPFGPIDDPINNDRVRCVRP